MIRVQICYKHYMWVDVANISHLCHWRCRTPHKPVMRPYVQSDLLTEKRKPRGIRAQPSEPMDLTPLKLGQNVRWNAASNAGQNWMFSFLSLPGMIESCTADLAVALLWFSLFGMMFQLQALYRDTVLLRLPSFLRFTAALWPSCSQSSSSMHHISLQVDSVSKYALKWEMDRTRCEQIPVKHPKHDLAQGSCLAPLLEHLQKKSSHSQGVRHQNRIQQKQKYAEQ